MTTFLESECLLIVATVEPSGAPVACRGWGLRVLDTDHAAVALVLDADDHPGVDGPWSRRRLAVTGGNVRTSSSVQCKGRVTRARGAEPDDWALHERYLEHMEALIRVVRDKS